jgi:hypothetical protein
VKQGDIVQIRRYDGGEHWIYAQVIDADAVMVQIIHPGNSENGERPVVAAADIRTKADLGALLDTAKTMNAQNRVAVTQTMAQQDAFLNNFMDDTNLHLRIVQHYQVQFDRLVSQ